MFEMLLKIFRLTIKFEIKYEHPSKPTKEKDDHFAEESDEILSTEEEVEESKPSYVDLKASQFEEELKSIGIVDIPEPPDEFNISNPDIPQRYGRISDDVEIITEKYEKEIEDIIEGRR